MAYKARDRDDLIAGIDEFLDEVIVLPPGEWDPKIRIEPPKKVTSADKRWAGPLAAGDLRALAETTLGQCVVVVLEYTVVYGSSQWCSLGFCSGYTVMIPH